MKYLLVSAALLVSSIAFGGNGIVMDNNDYSCAQFQTAVQRYGDIQVTFLNGWSRRTFHRDPRACRWDQDPVSGFFHAKNHERGKLNWLCENKRQDHDHH